MTVPIAIALDNDAISKPRDGLNDCAIVVDDIIPLMNPIANGNSITNNIARILLPRCAAKACFAYALISCLDLMILFSSLNIILSFCRRRSRA